MAGFNLSRMKKTATDGKTSTFQTPEGHSIKVLHSALSAIQRKQLDRMPVHLADGGDTSEDPSVITPNDWEGSTQVAPTSTEPTAQMSGTSGGWGDEPATQETQQAAPISTPAPTTPNAGGATTSLQGAVNQEIQGGQELQKYQSDLAAQESKFNEEKIKGAREHQTRAAKNLADFTTLHGEFIKDDLKHPINPNHYMQEMSTPGKVATAIGLFLGGMSTPFTHQGNPAMTFLNDQINRDIESQKANSDKRKSLYQANLALYHEKTLAENATVIDENNMYTAKIAKAASDLGTPKAKAMYDMWAGQKKAENADRLLFNANRAAVLQAGNQAPLTAKIMYGLPKELQQEAQKQASEHDSYVRSKNQANTILDAMEKEQTVGNLLNPQSDARMKQLKGELIRTIMETSPSKRLTPEAVEKQIEPFFTKTWENEETTAAARKGVNGLIDVSSGPMNVLTDNGLVAKPGTDPMLNMSGKDRALLKEVAANPKDPRAVKHLQQLRKKYAF